MEVLIARKSLNNLRGIKAILFVIAVCLIHSSLQGSPFTQGALFFVALICLFSD